MSVDHKAGFFYEGPSSEDNYTYVWKFVVKLLGLRASKDQLLYSISMVYRAMHERPIKSCAAFGFKGLKSVKFDLNQSKVVSFGLSFLEIFIQKYVVSIWCIWGRKIIKSVVRKT